MQTLRDIPLKLDPSFLLLVAFIALPTFFTSGLMAGVSQTFFVIMLFGLVLIHEYGHCWASLKCGLRVHSITLWGLGGLARIEGLQFVSPKQELFISAAGPATNAIMAGVAACFWYAGFDNLLVGYFIKINLVLGIFNLIPAYPLDGGHILKAILSFWIPEHRALEISARSGQLLAVGLGIYALTQGWVITAIIAVFIFMACKKAIKYGSQLL
jgi:stage IV sporulation protein FB